MSRAFVKEDFDVVERSGRQRSPSGLPPGATNYITEEGAARLREQLHKFRSKPKPDEQAISALEDTLRSVTIVKPQTRHGEAVFGATVTLRTQDEALVTLRIVGVDEADFHPGGVSWISPLGRALLRAETGQRLYSDDSKEEIGFVVKIT